jgi:hypothetical protein
VAAFRDAVALKVVCTRGLRRREAVMLDVADRHRNPAAARLGRFGALAPPSSSTRTDHQPSRPR